jgi:hypothetical protein
MERVMGLEDVVVDGTAGRWDEVIEGFIGEGFKHVPGVLGGAEVGRLIEAVDGIWTGPFRGDPMRFHPPRPFLAMRIFETDPLFLRLMMHPVVLGLARRIVGAQAKVVSYNVIRNRPGEAIDRWHIDRLPICATHEGYERHDRRWRMPVHMMNVQVCLTDVRSLEYGPTQYVPGSHYSGRDVPHPEAVDIAYEGRGPETVLWGAGDLVLHNLLCWHRGTPNGSGRVRYMINVTFASPWVKHSFEGGYGYRLPEQVRGWATEEELGLLGF